MTILAINWVQRTIKRGKR